MKALVMIGDEISMYDECREGDPLSLALATKRIELISGLSKIEESFK